MKFSTTNETAYRYYGAQKSFAFLKEVGYDAVDFRLDHLYTPFEGVFAEEEDAVFERFSAEYEFAKAAGIEVGQTHAPFQNAPVSVDDLTSAICKSVAASAALHATGVVIHPFHWSMTDDPARYRRENAEFFARVLEKAEQYDILVALENMPGRSSLTGTPEALLDYLGMMKSDRFVACFDTGHAHLCNGKTDPPLPEGAAEDFIHKLGNKLQFTHVHDNDGRGDLHTVLGAGTIDWKPVFTSLCEIGYAGTISSEASRFSRNVPEEFYPDFERFRFDNLKRTYEFYTK